MDAWLPVIYFARMDVVTEALARFEQWYESKHGPDLLDAGFYSAQAYHCRVGGPLVCNVYEIPSSEIFYTDSYNGKRTEEHDPDRPWILSQVSNRSNTAYEQVVTDGVDHASSPWKSGAEHTGAVVAPVISTVRFDLPGVDQKEAAEWFSGEGLERWRGSAGLQTVRVCKQAGRLHPANPSTEPEWTALFEWRDLDAVGGTQDLESVTAWLGRAPGAVTRIAYDVAEITVSLRR